MKSFSIAFCLSLIALCSNAQGGYTMSEGDSLHQAGDIKGTIAYFKKTYAKEGKNFKDFFNYACVLALDNQADSAFKYLLLQYDSTPGFGAFCDPDLVNLRKDKGWKDFETTLITRIQNTPDKKIKDVEYAKALWLMMATDQLYYDCIDLAERKIGPNSSVVLAFWDVKEEINKKNQAELEALVAKKGWPKISDVGDRASQAAFLIIQHSDLEKQKKYLPTIEKLCKQKECDWGNYALMYDRIEVGEKRPQKYGSQIRLNDQTGKFELFPLLDETKVDEWRKEVDLGPLADYVKNWHIVFEVKK